MMWCKSLGWHGTSCT